ncbi:MAG TPA: extracellular solute-binding protein, partial [Tepidisphaeraceae bacterium]|nr:extracellular solute-binding protein [Tepidisphaeraceae bacterium]
IHDASPDVFANTLNRPSPVGADGQHEISTMLLCVTAQSKHPRQATRLAQFITSAENQLAFAKIVSILPSTPESLLDPHFRQTATKLDQSRAISAASMRNATSHIPALAAWPELTSVFEERIKSALLDGADVGATLNMIGREWNGILAGMLAPGPFGSDDVADAAHSRSISRDAPR